MKIELAKKDDFDFIYKSYRYETTLGMPYPQYIRENIDKNNFLVCKDDLGLNMAYCNFLVRKKGDYVTIHLIYTDPKYRNLGLAKSMISFLKTKYSMPIRAVCISNSISEDFWKKISKKIGTKFSKKGTELSIYAS